MRLLRRFGEHRFIEQVLEPEILADGPGRRKAAGRSSHCQPWGRASPLAVRRYIRGSAREGARPKPPRRYCAMAMCPLTGTRPGGSPGSHLLTGGVGADDPADGAHHARD